jgi:hypothetical protein
VFEVADGQVDFGVAAVIGIQVEHLAGPVGNERVVVVDRE